MGKRKDRKSRNEEKVVGFSSASLFLARKREVVTRVETSAKLMETNKKN